MEIELILNKICCEKIGSIDFSGSGFWELMEEFGMKPVEFPFVSERIEGVVGGLVYRKLMEDLGMKPVEFPFVSECFEEVVGDRPFVQRIGSKE